MKTTEKLKKQATELMKRGYSQTLIESKMWAMRDSNTSIKMIKKIIEKIIA
jgi:hypothetical protein